MVRSAAAIVAASAPHRGIGYQGQLVCHRLCSFVYRIDYAHLFFPLHISRSRSLARRRNKQTKKPWRLPADLKHFAKITTEAPEPTQRNAVVMGRKTWESIPDQYRPLPNRINVVLSRSARSLSIELPPGVIAADSMGDAMQQLSEQFAPDAVGDVYVIGGAQVYEQAIQEGWVDRVIYTEVSNLPKDIRFDAFFPELDKSQWEKQPYYDEKENGQGVDGKSGIHYTFLQFHRKRNVEELQYLEMCRDIIEKGTVKGDRTGTGTRSKFGTQMRFSLRDGRLPLLTTKRVFWRGVAEELLWFISVCAITSLTQPL